MVAQHWKKVGIQADIVELERSLATKRVAANDLQIIVFGNDGSDFMFATPSYVLPVLLTPLASMIGPLYAKWYVSNGAQGVKPEDPELLRGMELFRAAASQPDRGAHQDGPGDLEAPGGGVLRHRDGRAVAGRARGARGQEHDGERAGAGDQRQLLPDAERDPPLDAVLQELNGGSGFWVLGGFPSPPIPFSTTPSNLTRRLHHQVVDDDACVGDTWQSA